MNFSENEHLFITRIYDAVLNESSWVGVLDEFAGRCGAHGSTLMLGDLVNQEISLRPVSTAFELESLKVFEELYGQDDAKAMAKVVKYPVHTWVTEEEAFGQPSSEIPGSQFARKHWGLDRRMGARLNDSPFWIDGISINFKIGRGIITPEENLISQQFLPHIAKAVELSRPFQLLRTRFKAVLSVLNKFQVGLAILSENGEVIVSNTEADNAFSMKAGFLLSRSKKITLSSENAQMQFNQAVGRILKVSGGLSDPKSVELLTVRKKNSGAPWLLELTPLTDMQGDLGGRFRGVAVFIIDPDRSDVISTKGMQKVYDLTAAEAEICEYLAHGMKLQEIAERRETTYETARHQVKSIFAKLDVTSQAEVVRKALQMNLPIDLPD